MAARIFFSYSHDDEEQRNQLDKHLALLKRQGFIETWHDRRIPAGDVIDAAIDEEINRADVILLLVSASFIASNYCFSTEMTRALERHQKGEARVVPVIVRDCDWQTAPFGKLKAVPRDGKAIVSWANLDAAYADVARELRTIVEASSAAETSSARRAAPAQASAEQSAAPAHPRSGNLRVKQNFSDLDKSRFLSEAFEYVARYFEGSATELSKRYNDIETKFERVDARSFTAEIYRGGKRVAQCTITLGGGFGDNGISYSANGARGGNSFNERVSVEMDDQSLFLRSMGMFSAGGREEKLTEEGAAELFWAMLIRPLQ